MKKIHKYAPKSVQRTAILNALSVLPNKSYKFYNTKTALQKLSEA